MIIKRYTELEMSKDDFCKRLQLGQVESILVLTDKVIIKVYDKKEVEVSQNNINVQ